MKVVCRVSFVVLLMVLMLNSAWAQYESGGSGSQSGSSGSQSGTSGSQGGTTGTQGTMSGSQRSQGQMSQISGTSQILSTNECLGSDIKGSDGETLGTAKEFIGDSSQGSVKYVVLSADELHPVPWSAIQVSQKTSETGATGTGMMRGDANQSGRGGMSSRWGAQKESTLSINITKDQLKNAPTIDSVDIEQLSDSSLQQRVDSFYSQYSTGMGAGRSGMGTMGGTQAMGDANMSQRRGMSMTANLFKASDTIGLDVKNMQDETIGEIKDLALDAQKGNFAFGLISYGGVLGVGETVAAVPWTSINVDTQNQTASLDASKDKLDSVALEGGDINKLSDRQFSSRVYQVFGAQPYGGIYGYEPETKDSNSKDMNDPNMKNKNKSSE
ncbi:MAG: hypothetical protein A2Y10_01590 [Planctomycetes bacterium GWF2_41_51]|nr:MAG: hypothetical protein A2Y10_01590 [Planctomycetes bacterium GWF2_41_51]HBG27051.1 hypothetical protein [Phycisphaerales bacterium]